jgi:hypothetical protein
MAALLACMSTLMIVESVAMAVVYAILLGTQDGMGRIVTGVTWAHFYGRVGLGRVQGSAAMLGITSSAFGPLMLAWLASELGGFVPALGVMMMLPVAAFVGVAIAKPPVSSVVTVSATRADASTR